MPQPLSLSLFLSFQFLVFIFAFFSACRTLHHHHSHRKSRTAHHNLMKKRNPSTPPNGCVACAEKTRLVFCSGKTVPVLVWAWPIDEDRTTQHFSRIGGLIKANVRCWVPVSELCTSIKLAHRHTHTHAKSHWQWEVSQFYGEIPYHSRFFGISIQQSECHTHTEGVHWWV